MEYPLEGFDVVHASPPCQSYSKHMSHLARPQPRLIEPLREKLEDVEFWVIENVPGAPLDGVTLCGTMFGKRFRRHRIFETSFSVDPPRPCDHTISNLNPHWSGGRDKIWAEFHEPPDRVYMNEMDVGWMEQRHESREAVPPAYTEYIGAVLTTVIPSPRSRPVPRHI